MDFQLRCNHLRCREKLKDKAVVTTCSHIFCLACSDSSTLGAGDSAARTCPACGTPLEKPYDVTVAALSPTDDYKMSILSGLSPTVIVECANSGLAFWAYQSSQEIYYQEHANKSLKQQLDAKNQELGGVKGAAREQIGGLEEALHDASDKIHKLSRSLAEMEEGRKSLERDRNRYRVSYEKLKQKSLVPDIENAAEENAAFAAQGGDFGGVRTSRNGSVGSSGRRHGSGIFGPNNGNIRSGLQSARSPQIQMMTPSRREHPQSAFAPRGSQLGPGYVSTTNNLPGTPFRQPLGNLDQNAYSLGGGADYSIRGIKVGRQPGGYISRTGMNSSRPMGGMAFR